jgi:hypothetical protein
MELFDGQPAVQGNVIDTYDIALLVAIAQEQCAAGIRADTYTVRPPSLPRTQKDRRQTDTRPLPQHIRYPVLHPHRHHTRQDPSRARDGREVHAQI